MASASHDSLRPRRTFVKTLGALLTLPLAATALLLGRARAQRERRTLALPHPEREGVWFHGDVVLVREPDGLFALSAQCPHLGCRIGRQDAGELVCPCHGSRFSLRGERLRGPATTGLTRLRHQRRTETDGSEMVDVELPG